MVDQLTLKKGIELAVTTEKNGAAFYKQLAEEFRDNKELSKMFSILSNDEVTHEKEFRALLKKLPSEEGIANRDEKYQFLAAASMSEFFIGEKGAFKDSEKIKTRDDALARAFALEKATLFYYHGLKDIIGEHETLNAIIKAEKSHLVSVMKYMITGAKMRGLSDNW
jgi:rubrerythrin